MGWKKLLRGISAPAVRIWTSHYTPRPSVQYKLWKDLPPTSIPPLAPLFLVRSGVINPNYDCPRTEFIHSNAKIHRSDRPSSHAHTSCGQVPQTAFPCVIRLSEPSPLSNLSPVALHGLNTRPVCNTTPLSVPECDTEPVCVSMHPQILPVYVCVFVVCVSACVSNFSLSHTSTMREYVCVCVCCL